MTVMFLALLIMMATPITTPGIPMTKTVSSLDVKLQMAASVTKCPSVKDSMIHSTETLEILLLTAMSGQWRRLSKTT